MHEEHQEKRMRELETKLKKVDSMVAMLSEPLKSALSNELAVQLAKELARELIVEKNNSESVSNVKRQIFISKNEKSTNDKDENSFLQVLNSIDGTAYPEVHLLENSFDKSLFILKILSSKGVDWATSGQVHKVLYDVFKQTISGAAIKMTLFRDSKYTQRKRDQEGVVYRLAIPGEIYINNKLKMIDKQKTTGENPSAEGENGS